MPPEETWQHVREDEVDCVQELTGSLGIWRAQIDVAPACKGTGHKEAMSKTRDMYLEWRVERLRFTIEDDAKGWSMENWN